MARNYDVYYKKMSEALEEKIDYIIEDFGKTDNNVNVIVDIGCGDGLLIKTLSQLFPSKTFIGVELEGVVKMLKKENSLKNVKYMSTEDFLESPTVKHYNPVGYSVIFSSVLHEIFTFEEKPIDFFKTLIRRAERIYIRDMFFTDTGVDFELDGYYNANSWKYEAVKEHSFNFNGYYIYNKCITEFLLKQRYDENWKEELKEFYFSTPFQQLNILLNLSDFKNIKFEPYMNNYLLDAVFKETGVKLNKHTTTTHVKAIYIKDRD